MLKLLMLPVTIAAAAAKMTLNIVKWFLRYRIGKVVFGASLITAAVQHLGYRMTNAEEILILSVVALVALVAIIAPRLRSWWTWRREKHKQDERRRKWEKENYE